jgi:hypothetical protein
MYWYTYIEPTLRKVFSAPLGEIAGTIATSGLSVVAFLIHPLGGSFFGPFRASGAGRQAEDLPAPPTELTAWARRSGSTLCGV